MRAGVLIVATLLCGCAGERVVVLPEPPRGVALEVLLRAHPLPEDRDILPVEIARGAAASVSLIQIRDREVPHLHTRYDLTVLLVRGHGVLWLAGTPVAMRSGDVAFVPRGTPHHFINADDARAVALVSFAPAFDGPDTQPAAAP